MAKQRNDPPGKAPRRLAAGALGVLFVFGILFVGFLVFYALQEPERVANPTDVFDEEVPEEGVAVPDGGPMTNEPTQAAPDSPARSQDEAQPADNP